MISPKYLSTVIVTYKSKDYILGCLQSHYEATQGISAEVIIVDNASGDGLKSLVSAKFPEAVVMENEENEGFARAVNKGACVASGRYLNILNPDTHLYSETLKILLNFLERHPQNCVVGARTIDEKGRVVPSCRSLPHIGNIIKYPISLLLGESQLMKPRRYLLDIWDQNETINVTNYNGYITGACILTSLDFFKKMGMFDSQYFLSAEDADFGFRVKRAGFHAYLVAEASLVHIGGRSVSKNPKSRLFTVDAYLRCIHKNLTFFHGLIYEAFFFLVVLSWTLWALLRMKRNEAFILLKALMSFTAYWFGNRTRFREPCS